MGETFDKIFGSDRVAALGTLSKAGSPLVFGGVAAGIAGSFGAGGVVAMEMLGELTADDRKKIKECLLVLAGWKIISEEEYTKLKAAADNHKYGVISHPYSDALAKEWKVDFK